MFKDIFSLHDKHVVISGANGILGRTFCKALAEYGAKLSLIDVSFDQHFIDELSTYSKHPIQQFILDLTDLDLLKTTVEKIEEVNGPVDVLFSNAATKGKNLDRFFDSYEEFDFRVWQEIMSVNLDAMFSLTQAIGSKMAQQGKGSIILTGSIYGILAPDQRIYDGSQYNGRAINTPAVYSASKAGVVGLAKYLATYWGHQNVRVNVLIPGGIESGQNEIFQKRYSNRIPLNRMGKAEELVGALIFLASDASSYFTGQTLSVDGGLSAW